MKVSRIAPKYKLLKPVKTTPGTDNIRLYSRPLSVEELEKYILTPASRDLVAIDIETRGLSPFYPHICAKTKEAYDPIIVGIGFAYQVRSGYKAAYFDPRTQSDETMRHFYRRLGELHLVAHNAMFDGLWLRHAGLQLGVDVRPNWVADTFGLFKQFAGQDYIGQSHGLKNAQVELLGWDEKGDVEQDEWLIDNGYYTESGKKGERVKKPMKGEQWRVPFEVESTYCALDCIATLQLFDYIFEPLMKRFPMTWDYQDNMEMRTLAELIDQQIKGLRVDEAGLRKELAQMKDTISTKYAEFVSLPEVTPHLEAWREGLIAKMTKPAEFKKNGEVSKNYLKYKEKVDALMADPMYGFNPASGTQLAWLFYERLYTAERIETEKYNRVEVTYRIGNTILPATQSGAAPVDKKALPLLGPAGQKLMEVTKEIKLSEYIQSYLECAIDNRMHPGWKVPGTLTGRLSGANPNILQIAKDPRKLEYLLPDEGYVFCSADFSSLENVVLAELSRDKSLLYLYGPNAKPNCGYLFTGAHIAGLKETILEYYDPKNPTTESVAAAKKHAKKERSIAKVVVLSSQYGAGANKIHQTLNMQGVNVTLPEVQQIHADYWELYSGVRKLANYLQEEWSKQGGYILNGIDRPLGVGDHHLKDLVNRSCFTADTKILTDNGIKCIVDLTASDKVWNGTQFCAHGGIIYQGTRDVINLNGVTVTPDHKIYNKKGKYESADRINVLYIEQGNSSWYEVFAVYCNLLKTISSVARFAIQNLLKS